MKQVDGPNGFRKIVIDNDGAQGEIYLHGAHVTHFQPRGHKPVLFLSKQSFFRPDKPIRGGVPICFPWFGPKADDPAAPLHGFARTSEWRVDVMEATGDDAKVELVWNSDASTRARWPHEFSARFTAIFGSNLRMSMRVANTGNISFTYQEALHTYLSVGDVRKVSLTGLEGTRYLDKVGGGEKVEGKEPIRFTGETDRVYLDTKATCVIDDPVLNRKTSIEKSGSNVTVVWNPWIEKAKALPDFGDDEWLGMLCVETVNAADSAITLRPGESHTVAASVRVE